MAAAAANGYYGLDDRDLKIALLQLLCSSSGGVGSGGVTCGTGVPTSVPSGGCGIYIQTDSLPLPGAYWSYFNGQWNAQ